MSTRRFTVLVAGLSQASVWRVVAADDLADPTDAEAAFLSAMGFSGDTKAALAREGD